MKKSLILVSTTILGLSISSHVFSSSISGPILNPTTGNTYHLLSQSNWTDAQTEAVALGGNLVTINDLEEHNWLFSTFGGFGGTDRHLWIGLFETGTEGVFEWVSGDPLSFTNWFPDEPNNINSTESYVHMFAPRSGLFRDEGLWNDADNIAYDFGRNFPFHGVVEVSSSVPEPSILSLMMIGAIGVNIRNFTRRRFCS